MAWISMLESVRTGLAALAIHRNRTLLSTSGVVIGVLALVASLSVIDGVDRWSRQLIERESSVQDILVTPRPPTEVAARDAADRRVPVFTLDDWREARAVIPHTSAALMTVTADATTSTNGRHRVARVTAATANLPAYSDIDVLAGRFFSDVEVDHSAPVIVLGHRLADELARPHDALWLIGRMIRVGDQRCEVIGVLAPRASDADLVAFVPLAPHRLLSGLRGAYPELRVKAASVEDVPVAKDAVLDWMAQRFPAGHRALQVTVGLERLRNARQAILLAKLIFGFLVALMLAIGGIGIMNVLLASVAERTREIGIRKAVGARARDIAAHVLAESVSIAAMGSAAGIVLGVLTAHAATAVFRQATGAPIAPVFSAMTFALAVASAIGVGVLFGSHPARVASRVTPIEAIQRE